MDGKSLEKHKKYKKSYGKNEVYWGLGIECESYLEMSIPINVTLDFFLNNHKRERYSVDYFSSYKSNIWNDLTPTLKRVFADVSGAIPLPLLLNAHFLTKTDASFEPITLFLKNTPPNPRFSGETVFQTLQSESQYLRDEFEKSYTFDGDSIEIMTQNFYKANLDDVLAEYSTLRNRFIEEVKCVFSKHTILSNFGEVRWMEQNHPFAVMATNLKNLAIFNNGTYHINITLPTRLDLDSKIADWPLFERQHKNYIRLIQWMEPLLVAEYGTADAFSQINPMLFTCASQRTAMSRYIGLGTYDTDVMKKGKLLTDDVKCPWYSEYHKSSGYQALEKIGFDINFNKHWNHGVELRCLDWFPESRLKSLLRFLIFLGDLAMSIDTVENPMKNKVWNTWVVRVMQKGRNAGLTFPEAELLSTILSVPLQKSVDLEQTFAELALAFRRKWGDEGPCSQYFCKSQKSPPEIREPVSVDSAQCCVIC